MTQDTPTIQSRELMTLMECPPGPFLFEGHLGFKTEYNAIVGEDIGGGKVNWVMSRCWPDVYCMSSGEQFWGGETTHEARSMLMVQPVDLDPATAIPYKAEDEA